MSDARFISLYKEFLLIEASVEAGKVNDSNFVKFGQMKRLGDAMDALGLSSEHRTRLINSLRQKR